MNPHMNQVKEPTFIGEPASDDPMQRVKPAMNVDNLFYCRKRLVRIEEQSEAFMTPTEVEVCRGFFNDMLVRALLTTTLVQEIQQ